MTPEKDLKERIKALIAADISAQQKVVAGPETMTIGEKMRSGAMPETPVSKEGIPEDILLYEREFTAQTGKPPRRLQPPEMARKEAVKDRIKKAIFDDMEADLPQELRDKLNEVKKERPYTLAQEQYLANFPKDLKPGDVVDPLKNRPTTWGIGGPPTGTILEKERRGEPLTKNERAELAVYYGAKNVGEVALPWQKSMTEWKVPGRTKAQLGDLAWRFGPPGQAGIPSPGFEKMVVGNKLVDYEPKYIESQITSALGTLGGMFLKGGYPADIQKTFKMLADTKLLPKIMDNPMLGQKVKNLIVRAVHGATLGPTMVAAETRQGLGQLPDNFVNGVILGEVFGAGGAINPKNKLLGWVLRQTANRMMAAGAGQYNPQTLATIAKGLQTGEWPADLTQAIFDEALLTYFSHKGTTAKQIEEVVSKAKRVELAQAADWTRQEALLKASAAKYKGTVAEAQELGDLKVDPNIIKIGEKVAQFEQAKEQGPAAVKKTHELRMEITTLYQKVKSGIREGTVMPEELGAMEKYGKRVPGLVPEPPAPPAEAVPEAAPEADPTAGKMYTTTTKAKPGAVPVVPPTAPPKPAAPVPDIHTPDHYVFSNGQYTKVEGKDVEIVPGHDTFLHSTGSGNKRLWTVVEGKTGINVGVGSTQEEAIKSAKSAITQPSHRGHVEDRLRQTGMSPRYVQAEGAGTIGFMQRTVAENLPPEVEQIEKKLLGQGMEGAGVMGDPQRTKPTTLNWGYENPLQMFVEKGEAGTSKATLGKQGGVYIIERPYGRLIGKGGHWYMEFAPGSTPPEAPTTGQLPLEGQQGGGKPLSEALLTPQPTSLQGKEGIVSERIPTLSGIVASGGIVGFQFERDVPVTKEQLKQAIEAVDPDIDAEVVRTKTGIVPAGNTFQVTVFSKSKQGAIDYGLAKKVEAAFGGKKGYGWMTEKESAAYRRSRTTPPQAKAVPPEPPAVIQSVANPEQAPGKRWIADRGAIPGEPSFFLDGGPQDAKAAVIELERGTQSIYEARLANRQVIGRFQTLEEAARAAEKSVPSAEEQTNRALGEAVKQQEQVAKAMEGVKGTRKVPVRGRRRAEIERKVADDIAKMEQSTREETQKIAPPEVTPAHAPEPVAEAPKPTIPEGEMEVGQTIVPKKVLDLSQAEVKMSAEEYDAHRNWIKGLSLERVRMVDFLDSADQKGYDISSPTIGYLKDKAKQELPPALPDSAMPGHVRDKAGVPEEKSWVFGMKVVNNLRRMGQGGVNAANAALEYTRKRMMWTQRDMYMASNAAGVISANTDVGQMERPSRLNIPAHRTYWTAKGEATGKRTRELLEGKIKPVDDVEAKAVDLIRSRLDEIAREAERLKLTVTNVFGEKKWRPIKSFYPHEWLGLEELWEGKIHQSMKDVIIDNIAKRQFKEYYDDPVTKDKAMELAGKRWEDFRHDLKTHKYGHLEMQRVLDDEFVEILRKRWQAKFPEKEFPLKLNDDISVLYKYLAGANNRIAWIQELGKDTEDKGGMIPEKIKDWSYMMDEPANRDWMKQRFADILRKGDRGKWQTISNYVSTFQLLKMTFSFIPNSMQWLTNTVPNVTTKAAFQGLWDAAKFYGLGGAEAKAKARDFFYGTGAGRLSADIRNAMEAHPDRMAKAADFLLTAYGFTPTEQFNRIMSAFAGKRYAEHLGEKLVKTGGEGWRSPQYIAELNKLGFKTADIDYLIKNGMMDPKTPEKMAEAGYNMNRITQFMTDAFFLPATWSRPGMRMLTQFKNFSYNQTSLLYNEPMKQAYRFIKTGLPRAFGGKGEVSGDLAPLVKTMMLLPLSGAIVYHFKKELYPQLGLTFYQSMMAGKSWPVKALFYVGNAGGFGISTDIITAIGMGPSSMVNLLGGPTISDVVELTGALSKSWKEVQTAIENKNPEWLKQRGPTIANYWERAAGRISPTARVVISNLFKDYQKVKDANQWSRVAREFYRKYKETYILQGADQAEEIWQAFMATQGKEYEEATAKMGQRRKLEKPTKREIKKWWEEQGAPPSERVPMSGAKKKNQGETLGEFYY